MSLILPDWPAPAGILAFTTTRISGEDARPRELRDSLVPRILQVHGSRAVVADRVVGEVEADAIHTRRLGIACRVVTADCLPILLCHRQGDEVGAIHAGWRGLAGGVVEETLGSLSAPPEAFMAWIGPAISQACYEVGAEVRDAFLTAAAAPVRSAVDACFLPRGEKYLADLAGIARVKLEAAGIQAVYGGGFCTFSEPHRFHSWRRDGTVAGRMITLICRNSPT